MQYLRSLLFLTMAFVVIFTYALRIALRPDAERSVNWATAQRFARWFARTLEKICGLGYVVEGRDNMPDTPAVVYLKHSSVWETIVEIAECPPHTWVLKRELRWIPLIGRAIDIFRCIAIDRRGKRKAAQQVVDQGVVRLREGLNVNVFPEGTRVEPGETRRYGRSGALLAIAAGVPVVPIAHNAGDHWPRRRLLKSPGTIRFCIGPPIDTKDKTPEQVNAEAKAWIDRTMMRISAAHATVSLAAGAESEAGSS